MPGFTPARRWQAAYRPFRHSSLGEKIETERQVVDLLDFAIAYGQGYVFGEPKPLREDAPEPARPEPVATVPAAAPAPPQPVGMTALFQARERRRVTG